MTAVILHLSDIHIRSKSDPILSRAQEIASCTFSSLQDASHLFVVISGDIAFSGEENQYDLAIKLFLQIRAVIEKEANIRSEIARSSLFFEKAVTGSSIKRFRHSRKFL